jgi:hypothetical protein
MKVRTNIKAGGIMVDDKRPGGGINHNQSGLKVRSNVKAGGIIVDQKRPGNGSNHNQSGLKVRSNVKAGFNPQPDPPGKR